MASIQNYGKTRVVLCKDERDLGRRAALDVARLMRSLLERQDWVRIIFAAGESQMTFLDALAKERELDWGRAICFNMDEFCDVRMPEEFTCGHQLKVQLFEKVKPARVYLLRHDPPDPEQEARRFEDLIRQEGQMDILCQGIGTSGHLAFNEPHDVDFEDTRWVRVVDISEQSKRQLLEDPNFRQLGYIPGQGITMTLPALLSARSIFTIVPLGLKRSILTRLFKESSPTTALPASILSTVEATLYVDRNSCPEE